MNKPSLKKYVQPVSLAEYPNAACFAAGHLVTKNSGWRHERPVVDAQKCVNCLQCYLYCPDGVIFKSGNVIDFDYDFCKGCGICESICKKKAITMKKEI